MLGYIGGILGFLIGLGFFNYPVARLRGYPPSLREKETGGIGRYFSLCTDHKVVGIQYLVGIGLFFFIGGLNAMLIRTELLRPDHQVWPAGTYLTFVGSDGTMMMGMMTSGILKPAPPTTSSRSSSARAAWRSRAPRRPRSGLNGRRRDPR